MHLPSDYEEIDHGERITYRGRECEIIYEGGRPSFSVDGEDASTALDHFESTTEYVGMGVKDWRGALVRAIDAGEGDDPDHPDYLPLEERRIIRRHALNLVTDLAEATESYSEAFTVVRESGGDWKEIHARYSGLHSGLGDEDDLDVTDAARARITREVAEVLNDTLEFTDAPEQRPRVEQFTD